MWPTTHPYHNTSPLMDDFYQSKNIPSYRVISIIKNTDPYRVFFNNQKIYPLNGWFLSIKNTSHVKPFKELNHKI